MLILAFCVSNLTFNKKVALFKILEHCEKVVGKEVVMVVTMMILFRSQLERKSSKSFYLVYFLCFFKKFLFLYLATFVLIQAKRLWISMKKILHCTTNWKMNVCIMVNGSTMSKIGGAQVCKNFFKYFPNPNIFQIKV